MTVLIRTLHQAPSILTDLMYVTTNGGPCVARAQLDSVATVEFGLMQSYITTWQGWSCQLKYIACPTVFRLHTVLLDTPSRPFKRCTAQM